MPQPLETRNRYMPGLDGLRAVAVLGVIAYHLGVDWVPGGLLGVGVFFTLSGYLITDLLLAQAARGGIRLKSFWFARARRLLPALLVMLVDSMIPEARDKAGDKAGLLTVLGFAVAAGLSALG